MKQLVWAIDVYIGHRTMQWMPSWLQGWWYEYVCSPSGMWECGDE